MPPIEIRTTDKHDVGKIPPNGVVLFPCPQLFARAYPFSHTHLLLRSLGLLRTGHPRIQVEGGVRVHFRRKCKSCSCGSESSCTLRSTTTRSQTYLLLVGDNLIYYIPKRKHKHCVPVYIFAEFRFRIKMSSGLTSEQRTFARASSLR